VAWTLNPDDHVSFSWSGDDGDGYGLLTVVAQANGFAGMSAAWFNNSAVIDFANSLTTYPLPSDPITLVGSYGRSLDDLDIEAVALQVAARGPVGQVVLQTHLLSPEWPEWPEDPRGLGRHESWLALPTSYERLAALAPELEAVVSGDQVVASIRYDRPAP